MVDDYSVEQIAQLRLIRSPNIGPVKFFQFLDRYGSAREAIDALETGAHSSRTQSEERTLEELSALEASGGSLIFWDEPSYSPLLHQTENPPPVLCTYGDMSLLSRPTISIVGARNASAAGKKFTANLARNLAEEGYVVVSGLARGIDTAAHVGASPGNTIAVMAGGIDVIYPPENEGLHQQISEQGLVLSEMPLFFRPKAEHFPRRNRIVSGLALGVIVVEAAERSGSLITARLAGEQGRDVFAVPGSPLDPRCAGTNALIRQGATLIRHAEDVLDALHADPALFAQIDTPTKQSSPSARSPILVNKGAAKTSEQPKPTISAELILSCLSQTPVEVDEIVRQTNLKAGDVLGVLMELELEGKCKLHPGQKVALS